MSNAPSLGQIGLDFSPIHGKDSNQKKKLL